MVDGIALRVLIGKAGVVLISKTGVDLLGGKTGVAALVSRELIRCVVGNAIVRVLIDDAVHDAIVFCELSSGRAAVETRVLCEVLVDVVGNAVVRRLLDALDDMIALRMLIDVLGRLDETWLTHERVLCELPRWQRTSLALPLVCAARAWQLETGNDAVIVGGYLVTRGAATRQVGTAAVSWRSSLAQPLRHGLGSLLQELATARGPTSRRTRRVGQVARAEPSRTKALDEVVVRGSLGRVVGALRHGHLLRFDSATLQALESGGHAVEDCNGETRQRCGDTQGHDALRKIDEQLGGGGAQEPVRRGGSQPYGAADHANFCEIDHGLTDDASLLGRGGGSIRLGAALHDVNDLGHPILGPHPDAKLRL